MNGAALYTIEYTQPNNSAAMVLSQHTTKREAERQLAIYGRRWRAQKTVYIGLAGKLLRTGLQNCTAKRTDSGYILRDHNGQWPAGKLTIRKVY